MISKETLIKVRNRDNGTVGYRIPEMNGLRRQFQKGEVKEITMEELRKLSYTPGGTVLLQECLVIENPEALHELLHDVEPEYFYSEEDVKTLLEVGTLDQLYDCLDFAPTGVIDLVKDLAVRMKLNDISKRNVILEKTGFNVTKAIEINNESEKTAESGQRTRRSNPINGEEDSTPRRRSAEPITSKYRVK